MSKPKVKKVSKVVDPSTLVRGQPKSGRTWKSLRTEKHTAIMKVKGARSSWEKKMMLKQERVNRNVTDREFKERTAIDKKEKREKQDLKKQRKLENERKAEIVVPITNTMKLKKMKRKHLRTIEKR